MLHENLTSPPLLHHPKPLHHHPLIHSLAHIVNSQQTNLYRSQGFHLHAGLSFEFNSGSAENGAGLGLQLKFHSHTGQSQGVAEGDEVAGFFCGHDGGDAGYAQYITFFGRAALHNGQGFGLHGDAAFGDCDAVGAGLVADVDHMGLALGVEVGEGRHGQDFRVRATCNGWPSNGVNQGERRDGLGLYPLVTGRCVAARFNQGIIVGC